MLPALKVGGVYPARVERIGADRRVLMRVRDALLWTRVETAVREGESVEVEVESLVPQVLLRLRRRRQDLPSDPEKTAASGQGGSSARRGVPSGAREDAERVLQSE